MLRAIYLLLKYFLLGLGYLCSTNGILYIFDVIIVVFSEKYSRRWTKAFHQLYQIDIAIASRVHGTKHRSISGLSHQRAARGKETYIYIEKVVDFLFWKGHCREAFEYEKAKLLDAAENPHYN